jgi:hypothetical protein
VYYNNGIFTSIEYSQEYPTPDNVEILMLHEKKISIELNHKPPSKLVGTHNFILEHLKIC